MSLFSFFFDFSNDQAKLPALRALVVRQSRDVLSHQPVHSDAFSTILVSLEEKFVINLNPVHTASFWNIIIQWTSHDDLTEKLVSLVS